MFLADPGSKVKLLSLFSSKSLQLSASTSSSVHHTSCFLYFSLNFLLICIHNTTQQQVFLSPILLLSQKQFGSNISFTLARKGQTENLIKEMRNKTANKNNKQTNPRDSRMNFHHGFEPNYFSTHFVRCHIHIKMRTGAPTLLSHFPHI